MLSEDSQNAADSGGQVFVKKSATSSWHRRVIATRVRSGLVTFLLRVKKSTCRRCRFGVHFDTVWGTAAGEAHRITWCQTCFNADCSEVDLSKGLQRVWQDTISRVDDPSLLTYWNGARSAVEELDQQGLV